MHQFHIFSIQRHHEKFESALFDLLYFEDRIQQSITQYLVLILSSKFSPYIAKSKLGQFSTRVAALAYSMLSRFVYVCITFILKLVLYICILHVFIDRRVHVLSFFKQSGTRGIIPFFLYLHIVHLGNFVTSKNTKLCVRFYLFRIQYL